MGVLGTLVLCMLKQRGRYRKNWGGFFKAHEKILEHCHFLNRLHARLVIFMLRIRKKDAFVRPFKVIYAIYDSLGIVTVQNCAKITSKSITLHSSLAHQSCPVSMQPSSAQGNKSKSHDVINELNTRTCVEL